MNSLQGSAQAIGYQAGQTIDPDEAGGAGGGIAQMFDPDTALGQASLVALAGLVGLFLLLPKEGSVVRRLSAVVGFVLMVLFAEWVGNYVVRLYSIRHPDGPGAQGALFNT